MHIRRERPLDAIEQQYALDEMAHEVKAIVQTQGTGRVITQRNRHGNLFPEWAQKALEKSGFYFEEFNLCYQKDVKTIPDGNIIRKKFDEMIRPWAKGKGYHEIDFMQIFVMDKDDRTDELDNY